MRSAPRVCTLCLFISGMAPVGGVLTTSGRSDSSTSATGEHKRLYLRVLLCNGKLC